MLKKIVILSLLASAFSHYSCSKDEDYTRPPMKYYGYEYSGQGESIVHDYQDADIDFTIEENLNVHGTAVLTNNANIGDDLNLNQNGKVIIATNHDSLEVVVWGNANLDDTLFVDHGVLRIKGNLNINEAGFISCSAAGTVIIENDINQTGYVYGYDHFTIHNHQNLNKENRVFPMPYNYY